MLVFFNGILILGLLGYCCPCILSWFIAEKLGANPLLYCLGGFFFPTMPLMRYKTREKFGIRVSNLKFEFSNSYQLYFLNEDTDLAAKIGNFEVTDSSC